MATIEERLERLERLQEDNARGIRWATQVADGSRLRKPENSWSASSGTARRHSSKGNQTNFFGPRGLRARTRRKGANPTRSTFNARPHGGRWPF
jgi:hypothetical protein